MAEVSIAEDEVIFRLHAPRAHQVYLVGDFNDWNPTLERMLLIGDAWEAMVFLGEGTYRYKFVVDGKTIVDPDNPGRRPDLGSPLTLIEQTGGMILSTEEPESEAAVPVLQPWVRYVGRFSNDDPEELDFQQFDLGASFDRSNLRGRLVISSRDDSWKGSLSEVETGFNLGRVEVDLGSFQLRGYEHDTTWTSTDPASLIGNDGLFRYNTGFERHGAAASWSASGNFLVNFLYDDQRSRAGTDARITAADLGDFATGASSDTTLYSYSRSIGDADRLALEIVLDAGDVKMGYVLREDRGLHPGILAEVTRGAGVFPSTVYTTRENRSASFYWLGYGALPFGAAVNAGWGHADSHIDALYRAQVVVDTSLGVSVPASGENDGSSEQFEKSDRVVVRLHGPDEARWSWSAAWDFVRFEFPLAPGGPRADVHRLEGRIHRTASQWDASLAVLYTDQDYGQTPDALHIDSPERNVWLNQWDNFTIANIVGIDTRAYTLVRADATWGSGVRTGPVPATASTVAGLSVAQPGVEFAWWQAGASWGIYRGFYVELDGRLARYDKPSWQYAGSFASGYAEAGYRAGFGEINLGWGFDPVIFDRVINDYWHIGRRQVLRRSLDGGVERSRAAGIGNALIEHEKGLEGNHSIKLETVIRF